MITLVVIHQQKQLFALILSVLQREVVNSIIEYGSSYSICRDAGKKWWPIRTYGKYMLKHTVITYQVEKNIYIFVCGSFWDTVFQGEMGLTIHFWGTCMLNVKMASVRKVVVYTAGTCSHNTSCLKGETVRTVINHFTRISYGPSGKYRSVLCILNFCWCWFA